MARAWKRSDTMQWYVLHGRKGKILVGPDKKAAEYLANKINVEEAQRRAGLLPKEDPKLLKKPQIEGLEEFFNYYLQWAEQNLRKSSFVRYRSILRGFRVFLGSAFPQVTRLDQLEPVVFERYKLYRKTTPILRNGLPLTPKIAKALAAKGRPATPARDVTVNVELEILRAVFNHAVDKGFLVKNSIKGVRLLEVRQESVKRILNVEEATKFLRHVRKADLEDYEMFSVILHTGLRIGELLHLHWSIVDPRHRVIHLRPFEFHDPKTGTKSWWSPKSKRERGRREIPIDDVTLSIFRRREKGRAADGFVFGPHGDPGQRAKRARRRLLGYMKAVGISGIQGPHNLRHTFISWLAMAGKPKESIMDIVGHVEEATFELYRHTTPEHRAGLMDAVDLDL